MIITLSCEHLPSKRKLCHRNSKTNCTVRASGNRTAQGAFPVMAGQSHFGYLHNEADKCKADIHFR